MKKRKQTRQEAIEEFRAHYQEEFGKVLSEEEIQEIATRLLEFFGVLPKPGSGEAEEKTN